MNHTANQSIHCSVSSCAHHASGQDYCTLKEIKVGCCDNAVAKCDQTECASFHLGNHGASCGCK